LHTRFKKGNRANPRGRPPRIRNLTTMLTEALDARVVVTAGGRRRRIAKRELGITQLADKFAEADPSVTKLLLRLMLEFERRPPDPVERPDREAADKIVIANLLARLRPP
jgi:Family of unknown function (DUF5681)